MSNDPILTGIKQRQDSGTLDFGEDVIVELEFLFKDYGLPSPYGGYSDEFFEFMQDAAELAQRMLDAENADRITEAHFFRRQLTGLAYRAKARFGKPGTPPPR